MNYSRYILPNGLRLLVHEERDTPLATVNLLYQVGSKDEDPNHTGLAHLFEHLMFSGTKRVPDYDAAVESLGGEDNAFTNTDFTNYYLTVPASYLEQALMLEADRMTGLALTDKALQVQRQVVTEEYHQRYMNQPYGDVWLQLRPLCYTRHPYRWATIGADIRHVQEASAEVLMDFYHRFYRPSNAILAVAGNVDSDQVLQLVQRYFGPIADNAAPLVRHYPAEPEQTAERRIRLERKVPSAALYMAFPMCDRLHADFVAHDIISDLLSNGPSSRLFSRLVKERQLFAELDAYVMGEVERSLFVVSGKLSAGTDLPTAEAAVRQELDNLQDLEADELEKVVNKYECTFAFNHYKVADRAQELCYYEMLGHPEWINTEPDLYRQVSVDQVKNVAKRLFDREKGNVLEIYNL